jgi:hypothetical protein
MGRSIIQSHSRKIPNKGRFLHNLYYKKTEVKKGTIINNKIRKIKIIVTFKVLLNCCPVGGSFMGESWTASIYDILM